MGKRRKAKGENNDEYMATICRRWEGAVMLRCRQNCKILAKANQWTNRRNKKRINGEKKNDKRRKQVECRAENDAE